MIDISGNAPKRANLTRAYISTKNFFCIEFLYLRLLVAGNYQSYTDWSVSMTELVRYRGKCSLTNLVATSKKSLALLVFNNHTK